MRRRRDPSSSFARFAHSPGATSTYPAGWPVDERTHKIIPAGKRPSNAIGSGTKIVTGPGSAT
jgi:hypothetical protein